MKGNKIAIITLIGLISWFALIKTSSSQNNQIKQTKQTPIKAQISTPKTKPRRFAINVTLTDPSDLKNDCPA